jgi:hypothetical protein
MHPAIAKIVSDCFYDGTIKTNDEVEKKYRNETPPFRFSDSRLTERHFLARGSLGFTPNGQMYASVSANRRSSARTCFAMADGEPR